MLSTPPEPRTLLSLPTELLFDIVDNLELPVKTNLGSTNRRFKEVIKTPSLDDFLAAEASNWARERNLYTCKGCVRFRRLQEFADNMRKGKRCRNGPEAHVRLCLHCGVAGGLYSAGCQIVICSKPHVLCRICGILTDQIGSSGCCTRCSPASSRNFMRAASSRSDQADEWHHAAEHSYDGRHSQELYGVWPDV